MLRTNFNYEERKALQAGKAVFSKVVKNNLEDERLLQALENTDDTSELRWWAPELVKASAINKDLNVELYGESIDVYSLGLIINAITTSQAIPFADSNDSAALLNLKQRGTYETPSVNIPVPLRHIIWMCGHPDQLERARLWEVVEELIIFNEEYKKAGNFNEFINLESESFYYEEVSNW